MTGVKGRSGRQKKPSALKVLQGTQKPSRVNPAEPKPGAGMPPAPAHLSSTERAHFDHIGGIVLGMRVLSPSDGIALGMLACEYQKYLDCKKLVEEEGHTVQIECANGAVKTVRNPNSQAQAEAWKNVTTYIRDFGLSPSSRQGVSAIPADKPSETRQKWGRS